ncbi:MAG: YcxB family protein [Pseudomonadota bacterium]
MTDETIMPTDLSVTGELTDKDIKRLTRLMRGSTVGPTTLYYAGVTAPVIGASMALMSAAALRFTPLSPYWQTMTAALLAAMAGIVWYLIFMRWSYRHRHGRKNEVDLPTQVSLTAAGVVMRRGPVETRIAWRGVTGMKDARGYTLLQFNGADPLIVPDKWFKKDKGALKAFQRRLKKDISAHGETPSNTPEPRAESTPTPGG